MSSYRKKLIEVSLPLEAINRESAKDASLTHGHPSTLHRYWARRPLATCRAIIFASLVDDPGSCEDEFPTESDQGAERNRLHGLLRQLVVWKNSNDENILAAARYEIARSIARHRGETAPATSDAVLRYLSEHCPAVYDPFCGGGSIPLEAQRLGLRARGSDLNPLPVLITKAMVELPHPFRDLPPVNLNVQPSSRIVKEGRWRGTAGLANDVRYYGAWVREEAHKRIGHLYPDVQLRDGKKATVAAWLWARTVPCINPACGLQMPLLKTFQLCRKKGNEHWVKPVVDRESNQISWQVQRHTEGVPKRGTVNRTGAHCVACGSAVKLDYVREQASAGKMGETLTAVVAEGKTKLFISPTDSDIQAAFKATASWRPRGKLPHHAANLRVQGYGITDWHQLFTERQLTALTTFSNLLSEARNRVIQDGAGTDYADALCTYLALAVGRAADGHSSFTFWYNTNERVVGVFASQFIPMRWNFPEANPFSDARQNWMSQVKLVAKAVENLPALANISEAYQADATTTRHADDGPVIVTDPPYYDNIGYADLSDFFYVWLRPVLRDTYPALFSGIVTPKDEEMIVNKNRFEDSHTRFEALMAKALLRIRRNCTDEFPSSIFYAYKQQEEARDGKTSTGWETMLTAVVEAGFQIVGTWPMRTEQLKALKSRKNALASSIVLVCRPRPEDAPFITLRNFQAELKKAMPPALRRLTRTAKISPVDLAQAAIGPGMEVYSRYSKVMRISGEIVPIREALKYINDEITAYHEEESGTLDKTTQFCLTWFKQHGYQEGDFGTAQLLATATGVDVASLHGKVLTAERGRVKLFRREDYYERELSDEVSAWEGCQQMAFHLSDVAVGGGIQACAAVLRAMGAQEDSAERLARVLYSYYEALDDSASALVYNNLVQQWPVIWDASRSPRQQSVFKAV